MGKSLERSLFNLTWLCWFLCSWMIILRNFEEQPRRSIISPRPFLLTVSNALVKSINVTNIFVLLLTFFLKLSENKNHVCGTPVGCEATLGFWSFAMVGNSLFKSTRAKILPAMESRMNPLWLEQSDFF